MNPTRRSQVIHLLRRQAQLQRDLMVDEQMVLVDKYRQLSSDLDILNQEQANAHGHLRQFTSRGSVINPDLYHSIALSSVERMNEIATAESDVATVENEVDVMRSKLREHEERIKKIDEISNREKDLQFQKESVVEFNVSDALWLSRQKANNQ